MHVCVSEHNYAYMYEKSTDCGDVIESQYLKGSSN